MPDDLKHIRGEILPYGGNILPRIVDSACSKHSLKTETHTHGRVLNVNTHINRLMCYSMGIFLNSTIEFKKFCGLNHI